MSRRLFAFVLPLVLAGAAACSDGGAGGEPFPQADELLAADREFARESAERGAQAWADVWADRGLLYGNGENPAIGPRGASLAVADRVEQLRREPTASAMLWPGELGYTVGNWWLGSAARTGDDEKDDENTHRYLTVWQRDGAEWKVALDLSLPDPRTSSAARAFDFWLGDWNLKQRIWSGRGDRFEPYAARNQVRLIEDGGAVVENFTGNARFFWLGMEQPEPIRGFSVRVYYPEEHEWRIFWMDTLDPKFGPPFTGHFSGDVGEFLLTERPAGIPPSRIRFERRRDGTVDWQLALRTPDGESWQPLWLIDFRRDEN